MNIRVTASICTFAMLAAALPAAADSPGQILSIATGHSLVLRGHGITKIAVGDGKVAAAIPLDSEKVVVNPKSAGETSIFVWDRDGQHTYELTVTDNRLDRIVGLLRTSIDSPDVTVTALGNTIFVNGHVSDVAEYQRIDSAISKFKEIKFDQGTSVSVVDGIEVKKPLGKLQDEIANLPDSKNLRVDMDPTGNVVVSGRVRDRQMAADVLDRVDGLAGNYLKTDGKVVDRLAVDSKSQVDIKVDVLEVDRTAQSQLGLRLQTAQQTTVGGAFTIGTSQSVTALESPSKISSSTNPFALGPFARVSLLAPTIDLLLQEGHARLLSSPNLVTKPGKAASFLVGGQIPIPISNGLGTVTVDYKEFGVKLNVTPTIDADGGVDSEITPEISDLDFADGIQINGFTVPAFKTSKISTDVLTEDGESIVLGGLLRRIEQKTIQKIPLLGDIPVFGQLFRSTSYQRTDSDVVFVLTPTILTRRHVTHTDNGDQRFQSPPIRQLPKSTPPPIEHPIPPPPVQRAAAPEASVKAERVAVEPTLAPVLPSKSEAASAERVTPAPKPVAVKSMPEPKPMATPEATSEATAVPVAIVPTPSPSREEPAVEPGAEPSAAPAPVPDQTAEPVESGRRVMPPIHFVTHSADATPEPKPKPKSSAKPTAASKSALVPALKAVPTSAPSR